ncbi:MAG: glycogen/starch/alpha-glucan phosphorylase, partial [Oscillospiraceae bacterium]
MINKQQFLTKLEEVLRAEYCTTIKSAQTFQLHNAISKVVMHATSENWEKSRTAHSNTKQACYFSAEFLMGRMVFNNLYCVKLLDTVKEILAEKGIDINTMEDIEDNALGNGGLGRLAACFIDSAATQNIPLNGYGIRYKYGIFKQTIENGFQKEYADDWTVL